MFRFSIRDVLWLTAVAALTVAIRAAEFQKDIEADLAAQRAYQASKK